MQVMATCVAVLTDRYWKPEVRHNLKIKSDRFVPVVAGVLGAFA
jgi:hypothetical protein